MNPISPVDPILTAILSGKTVSITVSGLADAKFDEWREMFRQFRQNCGEEKRIINLNTMTSRESNNERLEIEIGPIPGQHRQNMASLLRLKYENDRPKIALR